MSEARCKGCDKPIIWGVLTNQHGEMKRLPLDPKPPIYRVIGTESTSAGESVKVQRMDNALVSHFATCPNANDFSGSKKEKVGE